MNCHRAPGSKFKPTMTRVVSSSMIFRWGCFVLVILIAWLYVSFYGLYKCCGKEPKLIK